MSDTTVIRQPAGQRVLALREAYLAICGGDACEAQLLNAQERWYSYKLKQREQARAKNRVNIQGGEAPNEDEGLWVRMNAEGWAAELLGQYHEKTIRAKLTSLQARGFLMQRANPRQGWDRTPQWLFQRAAVQAAVDAWDAGRTPPDLDPAGEDAPGPHPDGEAGSSRTNVRMDAEEVPNGVGGSSGSTRTKVRGNNTGIQSKVSFPGTTQVVVQGAPLGPADTTTREEEHSGAETVEAAGPVGERAAGTTPPVFFVKHPPADGAPDGAGPGGPHSTPPAVQQAAGQAPEHHVTPPAPEEVPGGPDARAARALLAPRLGGQVRFEQLLAEQPPALLAAGLRRDPAWLTLPLEVLRQLIAQADGALREAQAQGRAPSAWSLLIRALDEAIGARIGQGGSRPPASPSGRATLTQEPGAARAWRLGELVEYGGVRCQVTWVGSTKINLDELDSGSGHTLYAADFHRVQRLDPHSA